MKKKEVFVLFFEFDDHPSLDRYPPGMVDGEGGPSGFALRVTPYGDQKVREAVEDGRLVHETLCTVDDPDDLKNLLDPVQRTELRLELG